MAIFDVVRFNGLGGKDWMIYKFPREGIIWGSRLIVQEGQVALVVKDGKVCDVKEPGAYTLETKNLPILASLVNIPFGFRTPFSGEVYFINMTKTLELFWGTADPIQIVDPKYFVRMHIRAYGQMGLRLTQPVVFFKELIGGMDSNDMLVYDKMMSFYKSRVIMRVKSAIAETIVEKKISALEISTQLDDLSESLYKEFAESYQDSGFELLNFYVSSINFPDEDFKAINKILENKAEFEIMGDQRYATKRGFDVYETGAGNEGGVAGSMMAGGLGIGMGVGAMQGATKMGQVMHQANQQVATSADSGQQKACPHCHQSIPADAKFCPNCGQSVIIEKKSCSSCQTEITDGMKFCPGCGMNLQEKVCSCGEKLEADARFCPNCGTKA